MKIPSFFKHIATVLLFYSVSFPLLAVTYDFNSLTPGNLDGQDSWTTTKWNTSSDIQVDSTHGFDGSQGLLSTDAAGSAGVDASRPSGGSFVLPAFAGPNVQIFDFDIVRNHWGSYVLIGRDTNLDGKITKSDTNEWGVGLYLKGNGSIFKLWTGSWQNGSAAPANWSKARLVIDTAANSNQGSGCVLYKNPPDAPSWQIDSALQERNLNLNPVGTDARNPSGWDHVFFHFETAGTGLDNFDFSSVSKPTGVTLSNNSIQENKPTGTVVGALGTTPANDYIYELVPGSGDTDNTSFTIDGNNLKTNAVFDYGTQDGYNIRIRANSIDYGPCVYVEKAFTISVLPEAVVVDNISDVLDGNYSAGQYTLREAIQQVGSGGTITFDASIAGQTITLTSQLTISKSLTIDATGSYITISGDNKYQVFRVDGGTVSLSGLTITQGDSADYGGGIYNLATLTVNHSTFISNSADVSGGAIYSLGHLTINNSTFSDNSAMNSGGGIYAGDLGSNTIDNSSLSGNSAANGGGIFFVGTSGQTLRNTIIANSTGKDCEGATPGININNLIEDDTCSPAVSDDPYLGSLTDNGGSTYTFELLPGSPAINAGDNATCLPTDQVGIARPFNDTCDIGAYETSNIDICATQSQISIAECDALIDLYVGTDGVNWNDSPGNDWALTTTPCDWAGVSCNEFNEVTQLSRSGHGLTGTVPNLKDLVHLQSLILSANSLTGNVPEWLNELTNLRYVSFVDNDLTGTIPDLSNLDLTNLFLGKNELTGTTPTYIEDMTNLISLSLYNNQLEGEIPDLSALTSLTTLKLENNQLVGQIPEIPTSVSTFNVDYNTLDDEIEETATAKDAAWEATQTIAPEMSVPTVLSASEIKVNWTPISYQSDSGSYEVFYGTSPGIYPFSAGLTADKSASNITVTELSPATTYYFVVETFTVAHGNQQNDLLSELSDEVSATTLSGGGCHSSILVTSANDTGVGSLRQAIVDSCAAGTIIFDSALANQTITLDSQMVIDKDLTVNGESNNIKLDGHDTTRVFEITAGNVTLNKLTIKGGEAFNSDGGGILNRAALTVNNCWFDGNNTVGSSGDNGGAINNKNTLTITNSTFTYNTSVAGGGAIENVNSGTLTISNSTFYNNSAANNGGAIYNYDGTVTLNNVTLANNSSTGTNGGGAFKNEALGILHLKNTLMSNNSVADCDNSGTVATDVANLIGTGTCGTLNTADPKLGGLANNGGFTQTIELQSGSPAIDAGDSATCETLDQTNEPRANYGTCDIGAYEYRSAPSPTTPATDINHPPIAGQGSALTFDGISQNVQANTAFSLGGQATLELWFKTTTTVTSTQHLAILHEGTQTLALKLIGTVKLVGRANLVAEEIISTSIESYDNNQWHHAAVVINGNTLDLYVDGDLAATSTGSNSLAPSSGYKLRIGSKPDATNYFKGQITDVRVWNTVRSSSEIQNNYYTSLVGNETGLIGYWQFSEGSGTTANDLSPTANHGVLNNSPTWTSANIIASTTEFTFTTNEDTPLDEILPAGDPENDSLTYTVSTQPIKGVVSNLTSTGSFTYTPNSNESGVDTFSYQVNDGSNNSNIATITLNITPINDPPSFAKGTNLSHLAVAGAQTVNVWATDINPGAPDETSQTVTFTVAVDNDGSGILSGIPTINPATGDLSYTLTGNSGTANLTATLQDSGDGTNSSSQTFTIITGTVVLQLSASPNSINEMESNTATVTVTRMGNLTTNAITLNLTNSDTSEINIPSTLTIPTGQDSATFTVTALDDSEFDGDQTVTLTAAATGYITGETQIIVVDNESAPISQTYTLNVSTSGQGTVTGTGITCGSLCSNTYSSGTPLTLAAEPTTGWHFDKWAGDCNANGQVTMDSNKQCQAIFLSDSGENPPIDPNINYKLTVSTQGQGTVTGSSIMCGTQCSHSYASGSTLILSMNAAKDWHFGKWTGDCNASGQVTMTTDKQCQAIFVQDTSTPDPTDPGTNPTTPTNPTQPNNAGECSNNTSTHIISGDCVNQTTISDITIGPNVTLSGGEVSGTINNQGTLKETTVKVGSTVNGGVLEGHIYNQGTLEDVLIGETCIIEGGNLGKNVTNKGKLKNITILPEATVTGGTLEGYIVNQGTVENVKLSAETTLTGGTLKGDINNKAILADIYISPESTITGGSIAGKVDNQGTLKNITLLPNARIIGGKLMGDLEGDASSPAYIGAAEIESGTKLTNVHISPTVKLPSTINIGDNVYIPDPNNLIPEDFKVDSTQLNQWTIEELQEAEPQVFLTFTPMHIKAIPDNVFQAINAEHISYLSAETVSAIEQNQFSLLPKHAVAGFTADNITGLTETQLKQFTNTHVENLNSEVFEHLDAEQVSDIFLNFDANNIELGSVEQILPTNWAIDKKTGDLTPPAGTKLKYKAKQPPPDLPEAVDLPPIPDLDTAFAVGAQGTTAKQAMTGALSQAPSIGNLNPSELVLNQDDKGILQVTHTSEPDIHFSFIPDASNIVQADANLPVGLTETRGGFFIMTTPTAQQFLIIPATQDPVDLNQVINGNIVKIGKEGDVFLEMAAQVRSGDWVNRVVMFDPFVQPNHNADEFSPGIYFNPYRRNRTRSVNVPESLIGLVVYEDGTRQDIHPTVLSPDIFIQEALKFNGVDNENFFFNANGSFEITRNGRVYYLVPTFEVESVELEEGQQVSPTLIPNGNSTLKYIIQHENRLLTFTIIVTSRKELIFGEIPTVPQPATFEQALYQFQGVKDVMQNADGTFLVLYKGEVFSLSPTLDVMEISASMPTARQFLPTLTLTENNELNYNVQINGQWITTRILVEKVE